MNADERRRFIERLDKLINDNLSMDNLSVGFIADRMCMSESTLFRRTVAVAGVGVNEYVRNARLEKAAFLLKNEMGGGQTGCN